MPKQVLFVCTGNTCRSVMAHGLLQQRLQREAARLREPIEVGSAGVFAIDGLTPSKETLQLLRQDGVDMSGHMAQTLTDEMIRQAGLILVMEQHHLEQVIRRAPEASGKTWVLKRYGVPPTQAAGGQDIPDPIGKPLEVYEVCYAEIRDAVDRVAHALVNTR